MLSIVKIRAKQGYNTHPFPKVEPILSDRFRGMPIINQDTCATGCRKCADTCPSDAIIFGEKAKVDLGKCLFCASCENSCPQGALTFSKDYQLATRTREALITDGKNYEKAESLGAELKRVFGRSLRLRQVSAGGCNGCESDINVLNTLVFDMSRFGISIVASPRHADGLIITGPITKNMQQALKIAYQAVADPKFVIAVGACAISGGPYRDHLEVTNGAENSVPVDLYIPGCPPHPWTILDGMLRLLGQR